MKKLFTLLLILVSFTVSAQLIEYDKVKVDGHNYQSDQHTTSSTEIDGQIIINLDQSLASFSFQDLFTGEEIKETMTILSSESTPSRITFVAVSPMFTRYDVTLDYALGTVVFAKVSWLGDGEGQSTTYPHVWTYTFYIETALSSPQGTFETPQHVKKGGRHVGNYQNKNR